MSCKLCDVDEEENEAIETYVRVGKANVMIVGCKEHLKELLRLYNIGLNSTKGENKDA